MKANYMDKVDAFLIQKNGFVPVMNNQQRVQHEGMRIVQKAERDKFIVVELLDADALNCEQIKNKLDFSSKNLSQMSEVTVIDFQVFIFNSKPDDEKLQAIKAGQLEDVYLKKYLPCMVVDIENKQIEKLYDLPIQSKNIEQSLKIMLCSDVNIEELLKNNEPIVVKDNEEQLPVKLQKSNTFLTYGLIVVNALIWLAMNIYALVANISVQSLYIPLGVKENSLIFSGEYWRFITPVFLHANIEHIIMNCLSLFVLGRLIETIYGHKKYAVIYLVSGITGSVASFMFSSNSSLGASGAIFGLLGAMLYFCVEDPVLFKKNFGSSMILMIIINLVYGFGRPEIDNFAHIGGLIGGFFISGVLQIKCARKKYLTRPVFAVATVLLLSGSLYYGFNMSANAKYYQFEMSVEEDDMDNSINKLDELTNMKIMDHDLRVKSLFSKSLLEYSNGDYTQAMADAERLRQYDKSKSHYLCGIIYFYEEEDQLARNELQAAIELDPDLENDVEIYLNVLEQRGS